MEFRTDYTKRTARAPAKLNLYLNVLSRRIDGFHELETVMLPIRIYDSLTLIPTMPRLNGIVGSIELSVRSGGVGRGQSEEIPMGPANLVVQALELLQQRSGCKFGAWVELTKRIPVAAGLGGGSSDAAAALQLANSAWRLNWSLSQLASVGAEIGSDVPFFLHGGPTMCRGRGESVGQTAAIPPAHFVVVKPPIGLSTRAVYASFDALPEPIRGQSDPAIGIGAFWQAFSSGRINTWGQIIHNSLQAAASGMSGWIDRLKTAFDQLDFVGHQLSGSGSAYFGICRHAEHARRLATILQTRQLGLVYATRSCH